MRTDMPAVVISGRLRMGVEILPIPEPGPGQVRIRVDYVGVCGSDLHYFFEGRNGAFVVDEPLIPGHELSGRVDLDPAGAWAVDTPVTVHPARFGPLVPGANLPRQLRPGGSYLGSASTRPHTQGGLARYLVVDTDMLRALPVGLPVRRAVLAEPLAVALHAVSRAGVVAGSRVLVAGAGPIGLLTVAAARAAGAAEVHVTDVWDAPLQRAAAIGATRTFDVTAESPDESAYDVVWECSGVASSIAGAIRAARPGGVVVQVGMVPDEPRGMNLAPLIAKEITLRGAFRFDDEIDAAIRLLDEEPDIERVITHQFDAVDVVAAFDTARDSAASGKVIVALS